MPTYSDTSYGGGPYAGPPVSNSPAVETNQGAFPTRIIEMAFGYGPNDTAPVWTNISSDVTQLATKRGRQRILGRFEAGTATITLDNKTGKYSPFNAAGAYYGLIKPGLPVRVRTVWTGVTYTQWTGFIESWPLTWPSANDSSVTVNAVDATKFLNLKRAVSANYYQTVIPADLPWGWWRLNEQAGSVAADSSGNGRSVSLSTGDPNIFGRSGTWHWQAAPLLTADTSASTDFGYNDIEFVYSGGTGWAWPQAFSFEAWVVLRVAEPAYFIQGQTGSSASFSLYYDGDHLNWSTPATGAQIVGPPLSLGNIYHIVGTVTGATNVVATLYVNGLATETVTASGAGWGGSIVSLRIGGSLGAILDQTTSNGLMQDVAIYPTALTAAQVYNHYLAGTRPYNAVTTGSRIGFLATQAGIPTSRQLIDTGQTVVQGATADLTKASVLKNMQDQADTENGALFIDAAGNLTFFDRLHTSRSPYSSVSLVLGSSPAAGEEPYRLQSLTVPYDDQDVYNEIVVTPTDLAPQVASDAASQTTYGKRTQSSQSLSLTTADAAGRATFDLNLQKDSLPRIESVVINPADDPTMLWGPVLGFDLLTRVQIKHRPMDGTSSVFDQICLIEGIEHKVTKATWETTWRLSTTDAVKVGVFNESNFGEVVFGY